MRIQSVAFSLTVTLVLALAAGSFAFLAGKTAADPDGRFDQGVEEGERLARADLRTAYAPAGDGYRAIFERGRASGLRAGRAEGRRLGSQRGRTAGRDLAFA